MPGSTTPAFVGGDLPEKEQFAFQEGQDLDTLPSKLATDGVQQDSVSPQAHLTTSPSDDGSELSGEKNLGPIDPEKGGRLSTDTAATEEIINDPNVVDWDGPDDPANPLNWYVGASPLLINLSHKRARC